MFCDSCGGANRDGARFCRGCGGPLPEDPTVATPASPRPATVRPGSSGPDDPTLEQPLDAILPAVDPLAPYRAVFAPEFEIVRELGRGGMGAVLLGLEKALDRPVAIKVLPESRAKDAESVERFLREARLAAKLRHPHIVAIHGVGSRGGVHYFTMEAVDGKSLDGWVRDRGSLPTPEEANRVVRELLGAIGLAHSLGIVHRDLKPANVMVERSGRVVVLDFGLARGDDEASLTASGMIVGTPRYMSPEQLQGHPASARSDLYALGLVWYFLLAGKDLVSGDSVTSVVAQHLSGSMRATVAADPAVPPALRPLLGSLLSKEPEGRPASAAEVLSLLDRVESGAAAASPPVPLPLPTSSPAPTGITPHAQKARAKMQGLLDRRGKKDD